MSHSIPPMTPPAIEQIPANVNDNKIAAGVTAIVLGFLGIHKFLLGYTVPGLIMLLGSLLTCGTLGLFFWVIGIAEGILYLGKSDTEFYREYVVGRRSWF